MQTDVWMDAAEPDLAVADPLAPLVLRAGKGDETALSSLYDATSAHVFGLVLRILRDRGSAEEATLDVYAQVWRQATRWDPSRGSVTGWLLMVARSRAIDVLRSRARQFRRE